MKILLILMMTVFTIGAFADASYRYLEESVGETSRDDISVDAVKYRVRNLLESRAQMSRHTIPIAPPRVSAYKRYDWETGSYTVSAHASGTFVLDYNVKEITIVKLGQSTVRIKADEREPSQKEIQEAQQKAYEEAKVGKANLDFLKRRECKNLKTEKISHTQPIFTMDRVFDRDLGSYYAVKATLGCLLYTSPSPRDATLSRMPSSA